MISKEQCEEFAKHGAIVLKDFFSPREISDWRQEIEAHFSKPNSGQEWADAVRRYSHSQFHLRDDPTPNSHTKLQAVFSTLFDEIVWTGINELVVTPPEPGIPWLGGRAPHVDFPVGCPERNLINITFYMSDVDPFGGAFSYWPGSHKIVYDYFSENPYDYLSRHNRSQDQVFEMIMERIESELVEFTGNSGDILIWNNFLMHSATVNMSENTRIAIIGRWGNIPEAEHEHFNFTRPIFDEWALAKG